MAAAAHLPLLPISLKVIECVCSHSGVRSPLRKESDFNAIAQGSAQDFYGGRANFKQNLCCLSHRGGPLLSKLPRDTNSTLHSGASPRGNPPTEIAINHPHGSSGQGTPPRRHAQLFDACAAVEIRTCSQYIIAPESIQSTRSRRCHCFTIPLSDTRTPFTIHWPSAPRTALRTKVREKWKTGAIAVEKDP